jgi:hypothetical protein
MKTISKIITGSIVALALASTVAATPASAGGYYRYRSGPDAGAIAGAAVASGLWIRLRLVSTESARLPTSKDAGAKIGGPSTHVERAAFRLSTVHFIGCLRV